MNRMESQARPSRAPSVKVLVPSLAAVGLAVVACQGVPWADRSKFPVARIDGKVLSAGDLSRYLAENLAGAEGFETDASAGLDEVESRLFDNFVQEEVLLVEAERRGVRVTDEEIDRDMSFDASEAGEPEPAGEDRRRTARRNLTLHKLLAIHAGAEIEVADADIEAYLASHEGELPPPPPEVLSLAFASVEEARRARRDLERKRWTLEEALTAGRARPVPLDGASPEGLPAGARAEIAALKPGEVSRPVALEGGGALLLAGRPAAAAAAARLEWLRARAGEILVQTRVRERLATLAAQLRSGTRVELYPENLPFRYRPEERS